MIRIRWVFFTGNTVEWLWLSLGGDIKRGIFVVSFTDWNHDCRARVLQ